MSVSEVSTPLQLSPVWEEARKLAAFFRRDVLVAWSYRLSLISDWVGLGLQIVLFSLVGRLVDPSRLGEIDGRPVGYLEFVAVGIAVGAFVQTGLGRLERAIREERMVGTLESVMLTPTTWTTFALGSVLYDVVYIPVRTVVFLLAISGIFNISFSGKGFLPAICIILALIPFVWGLGILSAAGGLTFRRAGLLTGFAGFALTLGSTAYFPASVLPEWLQPLVRYNPLSVALGGARSVLLGQGGWTDALSAVRILLPLAVLTITLGTLAFRLALRRERRQGTLGLY